MGDRPTPTRQTEQTPKGMTVPVPKRDEFFGNLKKAAKPTEPDKGSTPDSSQK